jgi:hypothetical protein
MGADGNMVVISKGIAKEKMGAGETDSQAVEAMTVRGKQAGGTATPETAKRIIESRYGAEIVEIGSSYLDFKDFSARGQGKGVFEFRALEGSRDAYLGKIARELVEINMGKESEGKGRQSISEKGDGILVVVRDHVELAALEKKVLEQAEEMGGPALREQIASRLQTIRNELPVGEIKNVAKDIAKNQAIVISTEIASRGINFKGDLTQVNIGLNVQEIGGVGQTLNRISRSGATGGGRFVGNWITYVDKPAMEQNLTAMKEAMDFVKNSGVGERFFAEKMEVVRNLEAKQEALKEQGLRLNEKEELQLATFKRVVENFEKIMNGEKIENLGEMFELSAEFNGLIAKH